MYKSDPPQCCYYISIFANIWYLIKLIHSITIILRVFMFYKQRVLANFWGRKDSAICAYNINMRKIIIIDRINKIKYQMLAKIQL